MSEIAETKISGHSNQWVALIGNKVVASSASFSALVTQLQRQNIASKATVTHVSGTHVIL